MDPTAGFAVSLIFGQETLQGLVSVLHREDAMPHQISEDLGLASINLFLDTPQLTFAAANNTQVALGLQAWGPMTVPATGESPTIVMSAQVLAELGASVQTATNAGTATTSLVFSLDGAEATLTSINVQAIAGTLSQAIQDYLSSQAFHDAAQAALRTLLNGLSVFPPLALDALSLATTTSVTNVSTRMLDGALAIGIDLQDATYKVDTHGVADQLSDERAGYELALWINPVAVPIQLSQYLSAAQASIEGQGATLKSLKLTCIDSALHIDGVIHKSGLDITFSVDAIPHTVRTDVSLTSPDRNELWLEFVNLDVGVDRPWYLTLCEVFGAELSLWLSEGILQMVRNIGSGQIGDTLGGTPGRPVSYYYTLPNTAQPLIVLTIREAAVHATGFFVGLSLTPQINLDALFGPINITLDDLRRAKAPFLTVLPFAAHPADPQLFVRWTVRREDNNAVVLDETLPTLNTYGPADTISLGLTAAQAGGLVGAAKMDVSVTVFRALGATTTNLLSDTLRVAIHDPIDESHPYVRWSHSVTVPVVQVDANGSQTRTGKQSVARASKLHRTDFPGRCLMVGQISPKPLQARPDASIQYLDALPFPRVDLVAHRHEVCDYCFFGGPTKTVPIIP